VGSQNLALPVKQLIYTANRPDGLSGSVILGAVAGKIPEKYLKLLDG
jgi:hypothetical protein